MVLLLFLNCILQDFKQSVAGPYFTFLYNSKLKISIEEQSLSGTLHLKHFGNKESALPTLYFLRVELKTSNFLKFCLDIY